MKRFAQLAVVLTACCSMLLACAPPTMPSAAIWSGPTDAPAVALSFDGHLDTTYTPAILNLLNAEHTPANFFVTGEWATAHPDWVQRMAAEGHLVGSHAYSHRDLTKLSDGAISDELLSTDAAISAATGTSSVPFFRPPFGAYNDRVSRVLGAHGYRFNVLWTIDSGGWRNIGFPEVVQRCLDQATPGAIIAFHLSSPSDFGALPWIITALRDRGYQFVRLDRWFA